MKLQLPDSISSMQDLKALLGEVRVYARWHSHNAIKKRVNAKHPSPTPELSAATEELLHAWAAKNPVTMQSIDKLIQSLETQVATAPTISITLAAPPTAGLKKVLVAWCRANIAPGMLINFEFNAQLLGGMVVRFGSHVYDWSFRRQILENRGKFAEELRHV